MGSTTRMTENIWCMCYRSVAAELRGTKVGNTCEERIDARGQTPNSEVDSFP